MAPVPKSSTVRAALDAMRGRRAILVGDLVLDSYVYGETVRVSREAPVLVVRKERVEHRLGGGANTAANLATLGCATTVLGLIGDDDGGVRLRNMLRAVGADVSQLRPVPRTTPVKTRVLAGAFGTSRQQVLRIDEEPDGQAPAALVADLAADLERAAKDAELVVVSDYGLGLSSPALIEAARGLAARGVPVCVDSRYELSMWKGVTAVTPNAPETEGVVGYAVTSRQAVERAGADILKTLDCKACLVTQGRGGMTLFEPGERPRHVDIVGEDEVTDVTGAGDTVIATFGASLAAGLGMENGMRLANVAAGIVVGKLGTAAAAPDEIQDSCARHGVELLPWDA